MMNYLLTTYELRSALLERLLIAKLLVLHTSNTLIFPVTIGLCLLSSALLLALCGLY